MCVFVGVECLNRRKTSTYFIARGRGVSLVPVPTSMARCHSDIKGGRLFDVPAIYFLIMWYGAKPRTLLTEYILVTTVPARFLQFGI